MKRPYRVASADKAVHINRDGCAVLVLFVAFLGPSHLRTEATACCGSAVDGCVGDDVVAEERPRVEEFSDGEKRRRGITGGPSAYVVNLA